jgi:hypothetical protein
VTVLCCAVLCAGVQMLGPTTATTLAGLGALLIGGRVVLRRVFEVRGLLCHQLLRTLCMHLSAAMHLTAGHVCVVLLDAALGPGWHVLQSAVAHPRRLLVHMCRWLPTAAAARRSLLPAC